MRIYYRTVLFLFCSSFLFIFSCQSEKSEQEKMYTEVMSIHDDIMPEMGTIHRLKKQLKNLDTVVIKSPDYSTILNHLSALQKADDEMMDWMAEFSNPTKDTEEAVAVAYLEKEKEKISQVRDQMRQSIASAKAVLSTVPSPADSTTQKK